MEDESRQKKSNFHLAGIVPVAGLSLDFNMPWHDTLMPVASNYLAVERAVYECAIAGCETIWLVCHKETTPLIRRRLGDWIYDPTINWRTKHHFVYNPSAYYKEIPIYYIPIHPRDRRVRDGLVWSIVYGYKRAYHISRMFSRWAVPSKYYVSFPYGVYQTHNLQNIRPIVSSRQSVFLKSPEGKTAKDGEYLGFSFSTWEYSRYRQEFLKNENRLWKPGAEWKDGKFSGEKYPPDERYTGKYVDLKTFLSPAIVNETNSFEIPWYYNISSWNQYCRYLGSKEALKIRRPSTLKYHTFNPIGEDVEDEIKEDLEKEFNDGLNSDE